MDIIYIYWLFINIIIMSFGIGIIYYLYDGKGEKKKNKSINRFPNSILYAGIIFVILFAFLRNFLIFPFGLEYRFADSWDIRWYFEHIMSVINSLIVGSIAGLTVLWGLLVHKQQRNIKSDLELFKNYHKILVFLFYIIITLLIIGITDIRLSYL